MRYLKVKDIKLRQQFYKLEKVKLFQKFIFINCIHKLKIKKLTQQNKILSKKIRFFLAKYNYNYLKLTSKTLFLRRCLITNRNRSNLRSFNLSRIVMRDFIQFGILPGYKKAAW